MVEAPLTSGEIELLQQFGYLPYWREPTEAELRAVGELWRTGLRERILRVFSLAGITKERRLRRMEAFDAERAAKLRLLHGYPIRVSPAARIFILPVAKGKKAEGYGSSIEFEARLHRAGVLGPLAVTETDLAGCPGVSQARAKELMAQVESSVKDLQTQFPVLIPKVEDLRVLIAAEIKAIEAETKKLKEG